MLYDIFPQDAIDKYLSMTNHSQLIIKFYYDQDISLTDIHQYVTLNKETTYPHTSEELYEFIEEGGDEIRTGRKVLQYITHTKSKTHFFTPGIMVKFCPSNNISPKTQRF